MVPNSTTLKSPTHTMKIDAEGQELKSVEGGREVLAVVGPRSRFEVNCCPNSAKFPPALVQPVIIFRGWITILNRFENFLL